MSFSAQNIYKNSSLVVQRACAIFVNVTSFAHTAVRDYEGMFTDRTWAPGNNVDVILDNAVTSGRGNNSTVQGIQYAKISLPILPLYWTEFEYEPTALQRDIADFSEQVIMPAIRIIASQMNQTMYENSFTQVGYFCGSTSSTINSYSAFSIVNPFMTELSFRPERFSVLNPSQLQALESASSLQNSFYEAVNKKITLEASLRRLAGIDIFQDPSIQPYTAGTAISATVATEVSSGSTISLTGLTPSTTGIFLPGDLIAISGINIYNPYLGKILTSRTGQFTITASSDSDSSGNATISVFPSIDFSTVRKNLYSSTSSIPAGALVTPVGDHTSNIVYTSRGLIMANPPLAPLDTPYSATHTDKENKLSLRISRSAQQSQNQNTMRIDSQMATTWVPSQAIRLVAQNISNS